LLHQGNTGYL